MDEDWVSITDAADRLTTAGDQITRSSLSRYLSKHADALPLRKSGKSNLVDYVQLRQHRRENIRLAVAAAAASPAHAAAQPDKKNPEAAFQGTKVNGAARKALADAEMRELDLAERRGQLTPTSEVDKAGRDAIALMRSAYERAVETEASSLSVKYGWDERMIRLALKNFAKTGLDVFHREVLKSLDHFRRIDAAAEQERAQKPDNNGADKTKEYAGRMADYLQ